MHECVASSAKRDEVLLCIIPGLAPQFLMVNLEMRQRAAAVIHVRKMEASHTGLSEKAAPFSHSRSMRSPISAKSGSSFM